MKDYIPWNIDADLVPFHFIIVRIIDAHGVEELTPDQLRDDLRICRTSLQLNIT